MALEALERENELSNPLDRVERIAEAYDWAVSRTDAREVTMEVSGGWSDMTISLNWRDEFEILHVAVSLEMKVPSTRRDEVAKLLARINEQLLVGHFDLWHLDGSLVFRNNLLLSGNAEANDAQCEALIRFAVDTCERYFPAVQFVVWAGQPAEQALEAARIDTWGEAYWGVRPDGEAHRNAGAGGCRQDGRRHAGRLARRGCRPHAHRGAGPFAAAGDEGAAAAPWHSPEP